MKILTKQRCFRLFEDVQIEFRSLSYVYIGQLAGRVPTEVGCETLFSVSGQLNCSRRMSMFVRLYERLVIGKHRMSRIYVSSGNVKKRYLQRHIANNWDEDEERDSREYLEQEREIWQEGNPRNAAAMAEEDEQVAEENEGEGEDDEDEDNEEDIEEKQLEGSDGRSSDEESKNNDNQSEHGTEWNSPMANNC